MADAVVTRLGLDGLHASLWAGYNGLVESCAVDKLSMGNPDPSKDEFVAYLMSVESTWPKQTAEWIESLFREFDERRYAVATANLIILFQFCIRGRRLPHAIEIWQLYAPLLREIDALASSPGYFWLFFYLAGAGMALATVVPPDQAALVGPVVGPVVALIGQTDSYPGQPLLVSLLAMIWQHRGRHTGNIPMRAEHVDLWLNPHARGAPLQPQVIEIARCFLDQMGQQAVASRFARIVALAGHASEPRRRALDMMLLHFLRPGCATIPGAVEFLQRVLMQRLNDREVTSLGIEACRNAGPRGEALAASFSSGAVRGLVAPATAVEAAMIGGTSALALERIAIDAAADMGSTVAGILSDVDPTRSAHRVFQAFTVCLESGSSLDVAGALVNAAARSLGAFGGCPGAMGKALHFLAAAAHFAPAAVLSDDVFASVMRVGALASCDPLWASARQAVNAIHVELAARDGSSLARQILAFRASYGWNDGGTPPASQAVRWYCSQIAGGRPAAEFWADVWLAMSLGRG